MPERQASQDFLGLSEAVWTAPVDLAAIGVPAKTREFLASVDWAGAFKFREAEAVNIISRLTYRHASELVPAQNRERVFGLAAMLFPEASRGGECHRGQMALLLLDLAAARVGISYTVNDHDTLCAEIVACQAFDEAGLPLKGTLLAELARELIATEQKSTPPAPSQIFLRPPPIADRLPPPTPP